MTKVKNRTNIIKQVVLDSNAISVNNNTEFGQSVMDFITILHGDSAFEIRFFSDKSTAGSSSSSILIDKHSIYSSTMQKNKTRNLKTKVADYNAEEFDKILTSHYLNLTANGGGCGVFFTVNSPNFEEMVKCTTEDKDIINGGKINAQFVDIDASKEIRKNPELLNDFKDAAAQKIMAFHIKPSGIMETKNGFHVYWFVDQAIPKYFRHVQMQLIQEFNGDSVCVNESRVLRLPYFIHSKDARDRFKLRIRRWDSSIRYTQQFLKDNLPELSEETLKIVLNNDENDEHVKMSESRKERVLNLVKEEINWDYETETKIVVHCCQDGHSDKNASAWISKDYMFYHCSKCGIHVPIEELAEQNDWQEVLDEINRYDIDINGELSKMKSNVINVQGNPKYAMTNEEQEQIKKVADIVIEDFRLQYKQQINQKHQGYIYEIVQLMEKSLKDDKTYIIPLDIGGGKSTIIKVYLQQILKRRLDSGAIVVVDFVEGAKKLADDLNDFFGDQQVAFAMYGFAEDECKENLTYNQNHQKCQVFANNYEYDCEFKKDCRYFNQNDLQKQFPVLIITHKRLQLKKEELSSYKFYGQDDCYERTLLLIDEKPSITNDMSLTENAFNQYKTNVEHVLNGEDSQDNLKQFSKYDSTVDKLFTNAKRREQFAAINQEFKFDKDFWKEIRTKFDFQTKTHKFLENYENVIRYGGHKDVTNYDTLLLTCDYNDYSKISGFKTFIFDGTADIDPNYLHDQFEMVDFGSLRTYEELEINICNTISASRTSLDDLDKLKAFCNDVKSISEQNPFSIIYIPTFKAKLKFVMKQLKEYIDDGKVVLANYGATKGSNEFKDCDIVAICGILHKNENNYIAKAKAIYGAKGIDLEDIECFKFDKVRRFNDPRIEMLKTLDMIVDYSQEIKRCSQRNNAENVKGKVYIFHNDKILLDNIALKFPMAKVNEWHPQNMIDYAIESKGNNPNQVAFKNYLDQCELDGVKVIYLADIRKKMDINSKQFSKLYRSQAIDELLDSRDYVEGKEGTRKKLVKS